ncbi:hypothetical protein BDW74DRAFT_183366 [Aspergillus multicolor]|uniref:uncharacterized protein n=1 Tax=Aspergillus multicolor TaxID=41759 RepID=UPI003CCD99A8
MSAPNRKCSASRRVFLYLLLIPTYVLYALSLTGCLSTVLGIPDLFLVQITSTATRDTIRVSYFGICGVSSGPDSTQACTPIAGTSETTLAARLFDSNTANGVQVSTQDQDLIHLGLTLASKVFLPVMAGAVVTFTLGLLFFIAAQLQAGRISKSNSASAYLRHRACTGGKSARVSILFLGISCTMCFGSALSTTIATSAIQFLAETDIISGYEIEGGKALPILQWAALALSVLVALGLLGVMRASTRSSAASEDEVESQRQLLRLLLAPAVEDKNSERLSSDHDTYGRRREKRQMEILLSELLELASARNRPLSVDAPKRPRTPLFRLPLRSASLREVQSRKGSDASVLQRALQRAERRREGWPYRRYSGEDMV